MHKQGARAVVFEVTILSLEYRVHPCSEAMINAKFGQGASVSI